MAVVKELMVLALFVLSANAFSWKNCGSNNVVKFLDVRVSPNPIRLTKGSRITFSGRIGVYGNAGVRYKINVKLQKKAWFRITVPCSGNFGSCTYNLDCQKLVGLHPDGNKQCPLQQGEHSLASQTLTVSSITSIFGQVLVS
ncbi:uncharacterized protein LOC125560862 [Nematostella vectensis]|uniref:uncharacterized protein LOC125560862 n=1 Tax=Nematostella vectensis TaxID=45351 RepID=UPI002076FF1B|nr:uncharacterized protein LOC125560862 [Nematostella vectensis]